MGVVLNFKRVIRNGVINFLRHGFISLASIFIVAITVFSIVASVYVNAALNAVITQLEQKVDINVYFAPDAPEDKIKQIKKTLEEHPGVEYVTYISKQEALARFKEKNKNDTAVIKALEELDENPLGASLAIKAKDIQHYDEIAKFLESDALLKADEQNIIEDINYNKNKPVIEKLITISKNTKIMGWAIIAFLVFASVVIIFNTIRLAIYSSSDEIKVLKLVGASNFYARGPFVIEAMLYGVVAGVIVLIVSYGLSIYLDEASLKFFGNFSTKEYFIKHFFEIMAISIGTGVIITGISSYLTARKYLKI